MLSKTRADKRALVLLDRFLSFPQLLQIHSRLIVSGAASGDPYAAGKLVAALCASSSSSSSSSLHHTVTILLRLPRATHYLWNTVIRAHAELRRPAVALGLYKTMLASGFHPNNYTFSFLLRASVELGSLLHALLLHAQAFKLGWESYDFVQNGLIHAYAGLSSVEAARTLLEASTFKDVVSWTAMVSGYARDGRMSDAREVFDRMPKRNAVSWSAMITAYARVGMFPQALDAFNDMQVAGVAPNHAGVVGALSACGFLGALDQGRWIHAFAEREGMGLDPILGTALIDMYAKCGCIDTAWEVFDKMPERDMYAYTSMISGFANHGKCVEAVELFSKMADERVAPNEVTFVSVLSACGRMGMVDRGREIFRSMSDVYGIRPGVEHYGCLVDLLGRSGMVEEAKKVVATMPMEPDSYVLGSLLNACRVRGEVSLGEDTLDNLVEMGLDHSGVHVLLSNMYASVDRWGDVAELRTVMAEKDMMKLPGCSVIEIDGVTCEFVTGDRSHPLMEDIMAAIGAADKQLRSSGGGTADAAELETGQCLV